MGEGEECKVESRGRKRREKGGTGNAGTVIRFAADRLMIIGWKQSYQ